MSHEKHSRAPSQETPVAPRFSFLSQEILRVDFQAKEAMRTRRIVAYPSPPPHLKNLRDTLQAQGLLLGQKFESESSHLDRFLIPTSARPISHDIGTESANRFVYSDTCLFHDLGNLLGRLAHEGPESPYVLGGKSIGQNVAMVEFTRRDEPKILLVPGFEMTVKTAEDDDSVLQNYASRLYDEFGDRFERHADQFIEGFRAVLK